MTTTLAPAPIYRHATQLGWLFAQANEHQMPAPSNVNLYDTEIALSFSSLADLASWAQWADATIEESEPREYLPGRWCVAHKAEGTINEVAVSLALREFGHMAESDHFECGNCGAGFGVSAGFVPDGTDDDGYFETEVARHQSGACFGGQS